MIPARLSLALVLAAGCVKPGVAPSAHSSYDLYHLCGDANADGVCAQSAEQGQRVDTNLAAPSHGTVVARG
jgi:hypothetical protein